MYHSQQLMIQLTIYPIINVPCMGGFIARCAFSEMGIMYSRDDEEALTALKKFDLENYWRLASSLKE